MTKSEKKKIAFFSNNRADHSTASIFSSLEATVCQNNNITVKTFYSACSKSGGILKIFSYLVSAFGNARWSRKHDIVICHTMALRNFLIFALKKIFRYKLGVIIWDIYPESFEWRVTKINRIFFHIFRFAERACIRSADFVIVPSEDYLMNVKLITNRSVEILPIWHKGSELLPFSEGREFQDRVIEVGFGGQINEVRGFSQAITTLANAARKHQLAVHVFTSDEQCISESELPENVSIYWHGFLSHDEYKFAMSALDAGIVSLNPSFNLPAFPSKTIDYVEAALPILYFGPDLPAYVGLLNRTGIGAHIKAQDDLASVLKGLRDSYPKKREAFLAELSKQQDKIHKLLNS